MPKKQTIKPLKNSLQLNPKALALSAGIIWGGYLMILGWSASTGWGDVLVYSLATIYKGYTPGIIGGIIGGLWGFIDGAVAGLILAVLYNYISGKK